ncbi:hypothetical protein [Cardinium endosymbiont of Tipula unca]|uniref:hypothetical protein n=1 Tax=Cardinium endosymbiont of Tipula unca TaxID=3066216 RepID=UPI0030CE2210
MISLLHGTTMGCKRRSPVVVSEKETLKPEDANRKKANTDGSDGIFKKQQASKKAASKRNASLSSKRKLKNSPTDNSKLISTNSKKKKTVTPLEPIAKDDEELKNPLTTPSISEPVTFSPSKEPLEDSSVDNAELIAKDNQESQAITIPPVDATGFKPVPAQRNIKTQVTSSAQDHNLLNNGSEKSMICQNNPPHQRSGLNCVDPVHVQPTITQHPSLSNTGVTTNNDTKIPNQGLPLPSAPPWNQYPGFHNTDFTPGQLFAPQIPPTSGTGMNNGHPYNPRFPGSVPVLPNIQATISLNQHPSSIATVSYHVLPTDPLDLSLSNNNAQFFQDNARYEVPPPTYDESMATTNNVENFNLESKDYDKQNNTAHQNSTVH